MEFSPNGPLRQPCDALPDGVVIADADGQIMVANSQAEKFFGGSELVGRQLSEAVELQDKGGIDWYAANQPYAGLPSRTGLTEQSFLTPDGVEVLLTGRLIRSRRGGPVEAVALVLRNGRGRRVLDRERSDLVATVAHELRSPLTGVRGFVGSLLSRWESLNDEQKQLMLRTVHADAERLSRLITELLDVARIDTGRLPFYPREVDAVPLVRRIVELAAGATAREIVVDLPEEQLVHADPDKFTQVLTNLVDNGLRHGEGRVSVSVTSEPGVATFIVDDEGDGIEEEIRKRVFTKFWKHGVRGGSGLGMYIVNGLVGVHGGSVEIGSAPAGGARVVVRWPSEPVGD